MKEIAKQHATRAWGVLKGKKVRRLVLLGSGAALGALCPHLPASLAPVCHASADVARAIAHVFTLMGAF